MSAGRRGQPALAPFTDSRTCAPLARVSSSALEPPVSWASASTVAATAPSSMRHAGPRAVAPPPVPSLRSRRTRCASDACRLHRVAADHVVSRQTPRRLRFESILCPASSCRHASHAAHPRVCAFCFYRCGSAEYGGSASRQPHRRRQVTGLQLLASHPIGRGRRTP